MKLDFSDLKLVVSIADAGSITRGARHACLAIGSASERLRSIEADIGAKLFTRHPRGIILTEAGEILICHARELLFRQEKLKAELGAYITGVTGKIGLYANTSAMTGFLPGRLARWLAEYPDVTIELEERSSADTINSIHNGTAEAGLVSDAVDARNLTLEPVADDNLVLIVPSSHALGSREHVCLADVYDEAFIGLYPGNALQDHISGHARASGHSLNYRIRMSDFEGMCEMVSNGIGAGVLPLLTAERFSSKFLYRIVPLTDPWAQRRICICYKTPQSLSPGMARLLAFLRIKEV